MRHSAGKRVRSRTVAVEYRPTVEVDLGGERHTVGSLQVRVLRLLDLFGSPAAMADHFGVQRSHTREWVKGTTPTGAMAAHLIDLSFIWERATEELPDEAVRVWLLSPNRFLHQRPIEAVGCGRIGAVAAAWDASMEGSHP
jgi:hypothetical protein